MKKFYKKFTSKKDMVESISRLAKGLDKDKMLERLRSAGPRRLYIIDKKGATTACDNFKKFLAVINQREGLSLLHQISFGRGEVYHVYSKEDYFNTKGEAFPQKLIEDFVEEGEEVTTITEEDLLDKYSILEDPEDVSGSKKALHTAIKEDFNIEVKKNQKFGSMLEELASRLEE